jgi:hypothetical protein
MTNQEKVKMVDEEKIFGLQITGLGILVKENKLID